MDLSLFDPVMFIAAFGGGLFGAAIGALPAFIFTGIMVIAGEMLFVAGDLASQIPGLSGAAQEAIQTGSGAVTGLIAFGPFFGPHIAFGGGVAAAAFAAKKGMIDAGKDILTAPTKAGARADFWQVLVVGGVFGVIGHLIHASLAEIGTPTDTIAVGVWVSALIVRVVLSPGKTGLMGKHDPSVASSRLGLPADRSIAWLPFFSRVESLVLVGASVGVLSGFAAYLTGSAVIGFGIAASSLIFLETKGPMPVTHHIALPGALATLAMLDGGMALFGAIIVGGIFGVLGALVGELHARLFHNWGDTHIDSPAFAIFILTTVVILVL